MTQVRPFREAAANMLPLLLFLGIGLVAFVSALMPINSNDFWWHLKTGDHIRAIGGLPSADPFSYLPDRDSIYPGLPQLTLRQYWLAQFSYSLVHENWGLEGIILARAGLCAFVVVVAAVFIWHRTKGFIGLVALVPLLLTFRVILEDSDRPQLFAFVGVLLVYLLIETCIDQHWQRPLYLLVPMQLLLAQMHGGFVVGTLLIVIYAVFCSGEERLRSFKPILMTIACLCVLVSFVNPNGYRLHLHILKTLNSSSMAVPSSEYISPVSIWRLVLNEPGWLAYWGLLFSSGAVLWFFAKRRQWSVVVYLAGLALASLMTMRYIGFFAPVMAVSLGCVVGNWLKGRNLANWFKAITALTGSVAFLAILLWPGHVNRGGIQQLIEPGFFPIRAADFIRRQEVRGNLFNFMNWGGYLEYRLWPEVRTFVDSRFLTHDAVSWYKEVLNDSAAGREIMQRFDVRLVLLPSLDIHSGEILPLVRRLASDPSWSLLHTDDTAVLFVKNPHAWQPLTKDMVYFQVLRQIDRWQPRFPWATGYQRSREEALQRLSR